MANRETTRTAFLIERAVLRIVAFYRQNDAQAPERQEGAYRCPVLGGRSQG
jgi:hypothetical protein